MTLIEIFVLFIPCVLGAIIGSLLGTWFLGPDPFFQWLGGGLGALAWPVLFYLAVFVIVPRCSK